MHEEEVKANLALHVLLPCVATCWKKATSGSLIFNFNEEADLDRPAFISGCGKVRVKKTK